MLQLSQTSRMHFWFSTAVPLFNPICSVWNFLSLPSLYPKSSQCWRTVAAVPRLRFQALEGEEPARSWPHTHGDMTSARYSTSSCFPFHKSKMRNVMPRGATSRTKQESAQTTSRIVASRLSTHWSSSRIHTLVGVNGNSILPWPRRAFHLFCSWDTEVSFIVSFGPASPQLCSISSCIWKISSLLQNFHASSKVLEESLCLLGSSVFIIISPPVPVGRGLSL